VLFLLVLREELQQRPLLRPLRSDVSRLRYLTVGEHRVYLRRRVRSPLLLPVKGNSPYRGVHLGRVLLALATSCPSVVHSVMSCLRV
jgi:hypothetical protein